jgi:hypothetical protein
LSGVPTAPTAAQTSNDTTVATTSFVKAAVAAGGVTSFNSRTGAVSLQANDLSAVGGALLSGPAFIGTPTAPTATTGTNTTQLATTAFVAAALSTAGGVTSFNSRAGVVTLTAADITGAGGQLAGPPVLAIRVIATSGTYTPTAGMTCCLIECVGAGAGGCGQGGGAAGQYVIGGGGGSGAYARKLATAAQIGASQTVTIGAAGVGGPPGTSGTGGPGGDTSVGTLCIAKGAPSPPGVYVGGSGGPTTGSVGDFVMAGRPGGYGTSTNSGYANVAAGAGGHSLLGSGAPETSWTASTITGGNAPGFGGGGGGGSIGSAGTVGGGYGGTGGVVITEFK